MSSSKINLSFMLFTAMLAWGANASSGDGHINWWSLGSNYKDAPALGWLTITFLIFVYLIARMIKKPLSLYLETRSKDIERQIKEGIEAKRASEEKLKLYEEKLKSLASEIEDMRLAFAEQASSEKNELGRVAKESERRILRDVEDTINANYLRTKNRLAMEVIEEAMALAEKKIAQTKSEEVDAHLKGSFLDDLRSHAEEVN